VRAILRREIRPFKDFVEQLDVGEGDRWLPESDAPQGL